MARRAKRTPRVCSPQSVVPKRFLRRQGVAEYFNGDGWTSDPEQAKCFIDSLEAAQTCAKHNLSHVEMAIRVELKGPDIFCTPFR
jgi:hypothetical protein